MDVLKISLSGASKTTFPLIFDKAGRNRLSLDIGKLLF